MHDMDDRTRKEILGEFLMDELKAIREYVSDIPKIKEDVHQIKVTVNDLSDRMMVVEAVLRDHEVDIRNLKAKVV
jgi:hypothetical protein